MSPPIPDPTPPSISEQLINPETPSGDGIPAPIKVETSLTTEPPALLGLLSALTEKPKTLPEVRLLEAYRRKFGNKDKTPQGKELQIRDSAETKIRHTIRVLASIRGEPPFNEPTPNARIMLTEPRMQMPTQRQGESQNSSGPSRCAFLADLRTSDLKSVILYSKITGEHCFKEFDRGLALMGCVSGGEESDFPDFRIFLDADSARDEVLNLEKALTEKTQTLWDIAEDTALIHGIVGTINRQHEWEQYCLQNLLDCEIKLIACQLRSPVNISLEVRYRSETVKYLAEYSRQTCGFELYLLED